MKKVSAKEAKMWLRHRVAEDKLIEHALKDYFKGESTHLYAENRVAFEELLKFPTKQPNDEIWFYDNRAWDANAGLRGYALVRQGEVIDNLITVAD